MRHTLPLTIALALLVSACSGSGSPDRRTAKPPPSRTAPEPVSCANGGQLLRAIDIAAVHSAPVRVPDATIGGKKVPGTTIPGVDLPAQHIPAQCTTVRPAPGGCLSAVSIPGVSIPAVTIPGVRIPGARAPGIDVAPVERPAVTREVVARPAVSRDEVCQSKPTRAGQVVDTVVRDVLVRDVLVRDVLVRDVLVRNRTCDDKGECLPEVTVPAVTAPAVTVPEVRIPEARLDAYKAGAGEVLKGGGKIAYDIKADVLFDFGKADVKPAAAAELRRVVASVAKEVPAGAPIQVDGHTDAKGDEAANQDLSVRRAQAIVDWLATKGGIDRSRLKATGYGETKPVAPNTRPDGSDDPAGRAKNRRVVISAQQD